MLSKGSLLELNRPLQGYSSHLREYRSSEKLVRIDKAELVTIEEEGFVRAVNFRYIISFTMAFYGYYFVKVSRDNEATKYKVSKPVFIDLIVRSYKKVKLIGRLLDYHASSTLPKVRDNPNSFRKAMYKAFGALYGVNFDEIKETDINRFRTFN